MSDFFLGAVGVEDGGIFQLTHQICLHGINVDSSQLIPFGQFFGSQPLGLVLFCQLIDSGDHFVHVHDSYLTHIDEWLRKSDPFLSFR